MSLARRKTYRTARGFGTTFVYLLKLLKLMRFDIITLLTFEVKSTMTNRRNNFLPE